MTKLEVTPQRGINRQILRLALPAFGALIAEPLFLIADSAIVGHLGVDALAGVGLASTLLQTAVGLLVFLAYSTTPAVARLIGAGRQREAIAVGRDGIWLAALLGAVIAILGFFAAEPLLRLMGAQGAVLEQAGVYLKFSMPGVPAMLLVLAATGVLRGLQDTRTPLLVAGVGFALNAALNYLLVYSAGLGVAGSAIGTSIAQWVMAAVYLLIVLGTARKHRLSIGPHWRGVASLTSVGGWLLLRTLSLRAAILATVLVATAQGPVNLAAHQIAMTIFSFLAFALDAIAIAAQALIGKELGASNLPTVRALTRRMVLWGLGFGVLTGALVLLSAPWLGWIFSSDVSVHEALATALIVLGISQPVAGFVFVLDGVLIGAGDARYLALAGMLALMLYAPLLYWVSSADLEGPVALAWLWAAFAGGYLLARALTLGLRARTSAWHRTGLLTAVNE
ncbi:putative MATE family efflux protein [Psychromicrobium silvestre]|uniref:Probable multidrug resistance protein NorM n=1 Tax=Psychromicrobium silvestre TaxID=1645614 RepID=A0A7Y9S806_9MICC|nr:MATE family efflux transporter [Psychromicrobium silvestre]NYE95990.1 putative MATE family efflux protein [Psychromicrobium silvestre]